MNYRNGKKNFMKKMKNTDHLIKSPEEKEDCIK